MIRNLYARFIFAVLVLSGLSAVRAQNPGGVAPAAWYTAGAGVYADAGSTDAADNGTVQQWNSQVGSFPLLQDLTAWRPVFSNATTLANFNPTLTFTGSKWMRWTAPTDVNIIDRANGSIYAAGYWNSVNNADFVGFGAGSEDFPGLHAYGSKLLFYSFGDFAGVSDDAFVAQHYSTIGGTWENGAGTNASNLASDVSLNGIRAFHDDIANVNLNAAYRDFQVGYANYGSIDGQLNEILVYENRLTPGQMDRVETYLSIKYGSTYANGTRNYVNSAGSPVWTAGTNAGYHNNIAGIARDDNGALHQKQSWSTNPGQQVLIGTTGLTNTNAANAVGLSNGQFLLWGDNGLAKSPSVAVSGISGITHHFEAIWKVENNGVSTVRVAWPKGLNNLSLIQSSDATIAGGDVATLMTVDMTINGVVYSYADVTLADGSYFTFGGSLHAPGGILPAAWYRADAKVYSDGGTTNAGDQGAVAQWNEFNGYGFDLKQATEANRPVFSNSTALTNFNSTVTFDGNNTWLDYLVADKGDILARSTGTLFSVGKTTSSSGALFGFGSNLDYPGLYITANYDLTFLGNVGGNWATNSVKIPTDGHFIGGGGWLNEAGSTGLNLIATSLNGNYVSHDALITWNTNTSVDGDLRIGRDGNYASYEGQQNEMIVFDKKLTDQEMNKVETYLAIKWGQTLSKDGKRDYIAADGTVLWDGTANEDYYHNILGIAREDISALNQRQSRSVNPGQQLIIGHGENTLEDTNADNTGNFSSNGQYLVVGDNGLAQGLAVPLVYSGANGQMNFRFGAVWKHQNKGGVGTVTIAWPKGIQNMYLIRSSDEVFDASDSFNPMTTEVTINGIEYYTATATLADGEYFTFGGFQYAPGGVPPAAWYRADALQDVFVDAGTTPADDGETVAQWNEFNKKPFPLTQSTANNRPEFSRETTLANFNPTVSFGGGSNANAHYLQYKSDDFGGNIIIDRSQGALFGAGMANNNNGMFGFGELNNEMNDPGLYRANNNLLLFTRKGSALTNDTDASFPIAVSGNYYVGGGAWRNGAGTGTPDRSNDLTVSLFGDRTTHNENVYNVLLDDTRNNFVVGRDYDWTSLTGQQNEMIVFANKLSETDMTKVESYLAIKWGMTLSKDVNRDYLDANGNIVWNGTANVDYYHNVFGIAREDIGAFEQKVSTSINTGSILTVATDDDFVLPNHDASRTGFTNDATYFLLGDNAVTVTPTVSVAEISGLERIQRVWLAQRTNTAGQLHFSANLSDYGANFGGSKNVVMIIADDAGFTTNVRTVSGTMVEGNWVHNYNFDALPGNQYITYGFTDEPANSIGCNSKQMFYSHGAGNTTLEDVDYSGSPLTATSMGTASLKYNAAGYNSVDGFIYAISSNYHLVRVDNTGAATDLGAVTGLPTNFEYNSGDFIPGTGMLYVTQNQTNQMYKIDVANVTVDQAITLGSSAAVSDIAWDAATAKFYGVNNDNGALMSINPVDGEVTTIGSSGGGVFGAMMGACNGIYGISNAGGFYKFNLTNGARTKLAETTSIAPGGSGFDGAHCHSNCIDDDALPVRLLHFNGYQEGSAATLNWATVNERDNAGFDVERSADGRSWAKLDFVNGKSVSGTSESRLDYSFTDAAPLAGKNYYRLKQIDLSGSFEYSRLVVVDIRSGKNSLLVYPNPVANGKLTLKLAESEIRSVGVFSIIGTQMRVGKLQSDNTLEIGNLPAGQYFVRVTGKNGEVITKSFIVK